MISFILISVLPWLIVAPRPLNPDLFSEGVPSDELEVFPDAAWNDYPHALRPNHAERRALFEFAKKACYHAVNALDEIPRSKDNLKALNKWAQMREADFIMYAKRPIDLAQAQILFVGDEASEKVFEQIKKWASESPTAYLEYYYDALFQYM